MAQTKRVPTRVHTRKLDRGIARLQMKNVGMRQVAKHGNGTSSYFADHWREYCVGGKKK